MTQENLYVLGFRAGVRRAAWWRRSVIGTWIVNLLLSAALGWVLWGR